MGKDIIKFKDVYRENKIVGFIVLLSFFLFFFYTSSEPVLTFLDNNINVRIPFIRDYFLFSRIIISLGLAILFIGRFYKEADFNLWALNWLIILILSFAFSRLVLIYFLDSEFWWFIFFEGFFVGLLTYVLNKNKKRKGLGIFAGMTSLLAIFFVSHQIYFLTMEPPLFPSVLYVDSFSNILFWLGTLLILFFSAYCLSKGFLIKRFLK